MVLIDYFFYINSNEVRTIKAYFVKEDDKPNIFKQVFNISTTENNQIIVQPIKENIEEKQAQKLAKSIRKKCQKQGISRVVLSKNIQNNKIFYNKIYECAINTFDGKWLEKYMTHEMLDYIIKNRSLKKEKTEITILSNYISNEVIETIKILAKEYKTVNVVTKQIAEFEHIEDMIYEEYGMMMTVADNKRKSLVKSKIILNYDFTEKQINQYNIYDEAIIVNLQNKLKINQKRFNGLVVNDYEIYSTRADDYFGLDKIRNFYVKDLLEESIYRKDSFANIRRNITYGHYKIKELYGINGKLF